jgi:uncharacterized alpha-E superfamily protein
MYRQYCQPQVQGSKVIDYLLHDEAFPRAIASCVQTARRSAARLPRPEATASALDEVEKLLETPIAPDCTADEVSELMDTVQKRLGAVHSAVIETWFLPGGG